MERIIFEIMKLPIGIQTFERIREDGYLYIDKTKQIHRVLSEGNYFFLSRPRRFGKSLLLSTMKSLYEGRKDLFEGLWIEENWNWERQLPVIHVQFASQGIRTLGLEKAIETMVRHLARDLNISLEEQSYDTLFKELIHKTAQQSPIGKVVLLIDEYDKPIIDYLDDIPQANQNRRILKNFYSVLKDSDPYLELVFITGVSRFAKTSIFSDLNNLKNLTIHPSAMDLVGITASEVELHFSNAISEMAARQGISYAELFEQIRYWYNGYSWDGEIKVYNPFSLLSYFDAKKFLNFWFETGTPTFLVEAMKNQDLYNIDKVRASDSTLNSFDFERLNPITVLFQTGYLTINREIRQGIYELVYPNNEVKISLEEYLLNTYTEDPMRGSRIRALDIVDALEEEDMEKLIVTLNSLFSTIPSELWKAKNEAFYHALIHLIFSLVGAYTQAEVHSARGRLDSIVHTANAIYIFEFKFEKSVEEAIQQIRDKNYFGPYLTSPKKRIGIGINFSKEQKEIEDYKVVEF